MPAAPIAVPIGLAPLHRPRPRCRRVRRRLPDAGAARRPVAAPMPSYPPPAFDFAIGRRRRSATPTRPTASSPRPTPTTRSRPRRRSRPWPRRSAGSPAPTPSRRRHSTRSPPPTFAPPTRRRRSIPSLRRPGRPSPPTVAPPHRRPVRPDGFVADLGDRPARRRASPAFGAGRVRSPTRTCRRRSTPSARCEMVVLDVGPDGAVLGDPRRRSGPTLDRAGPRRPGRAGRRCSTRPRRSRSPCCACRSRTPSRSWTSSRPTGPAGSRSPRSPRSPRSRASPSRRPRRHLRRDRRAPHRSLAVSEPVDGRVVDVSRRTPTTRRTTRPITLGSPLGRRRLDGRRRAGRRRRRGPPTSRATTSPPTTGSTAPPPPPTRSSPSSASDEPPPLVIDELDDRVAEIVEPSSRRPWSRSKTEDTDPADIADRIPSRRRRRRSPRSPGRSPRPQSRRRRRRLPTAVDPEPPPTQFVAAGTDWQVGGIFPATAMADDGTLALRRADVRWALADLVADDDFTVRATVDFTSGAGFGILFRVSTDDTERITGYSFDVDPIYGGGGFLAAAVARQPSALEAARARAGGRPDSPLRAPHDRGELRSRPAHRQRRRRGRADGAPAQPLLDRLRPRAVPRRDASACRRGRRPKSPSTGCMLATLTRRRARAPDRDRPLRTVPAGWRSRSTRGSPRPRTTTGGTATRGRSWPTCSRRGSATRPDGSSTPAAGPAATARGSPITAASSASTCRADALAFVRARRPETTPVRGSLDALPFADATLRRRRRDHRRRLRRRRPRRDRASSRGSCARAARSCSSSPRSRSLRRAHDKTVHTLRRYRRPELRRPMPAAPGSASQRATYLYSFLTPPAAALALAERIRPHTTADAGSDVERAAFDPDVRSPRGRPSGAGSRRRDVPIGTTRRGRRDARPTDRVRRVRAVAAQHDELRTRAPRGPTASRRPPDSWKNCDWPCRRG